MRRKPLRIRQVLLPGVLLALLLAAPALAGGTAGVVNVNTASAEQLQQLPGVGVSRARAILELRRKRGGFKSVDELRDVKGIGEASLERLRPHLVVRGPTTLGK